MHSFLPSICPQLPRSFLPPSLQLPLLDDPTILFLMLINDTGVRVAAFVKE